jgi:plastocyanin
MGCSTPERKAMDTRKISPQNAAVALHNRRRIWASLLMTAFVLLGLSVEKSANANAATAARRVNITAANFTFSPTTISLKKGQKVTFAFKNTDTVKHNLTITGLNVDKDVSGGKTGQVTMTLKTPGTYEFHCTYHPQKMKGTITVG